MSRQSRRTFIATPLLVTLAILTAGCTIGGSKPPEKPTITANLLNATRAGGSCEDPSSDAHPTFYCNTYRVHVKNEGPESIQWGGSLFWIQARDGREIGLPLEVEGPQTLRPQEESDYVLRGSGTGQPDSLHLRWRGGSVEDEALLLLLTVPDFA